MLKHSVGATKDRFPDEHNDCSVCALANAVSIPYAEAHERLRLKGRRRRHSTKFSLAVSALLSLKTEGKLVDVVERNDIMVSSLTGMHFFRRPPAQSLPTVAEYLRRLPKEGRFYLACTTHAFAYVDGVLYDNIDGGKMRARMKRAVEVKLAQPQAAPKADLTQSDISAMWERLNKVAEKL